MKLLIVYATTEGQTRKIAEYLMAQAEKAGVQTSLCDATMEQPFPDKYDAVMIGASMHMQRYQTAITHYIKTHLSVLNEKPTAFFSVTLTAAGDDQASWKELGEITNAFLLDTGWKPSMVEQVAGALRFTQYDFFKKYIMRMIASKAGRPDTSGDDHEYTDWVKVKEFLDGFLKHARVTSPKLAEEIL